MRAPRLLLPLLLVPIGCADKGKGGSPDLAPAAADPGPTNALVERRPYDLVRPIGHDPKHPTPLVLLLHGFGANAAVQSAYWNLSRFAEQRGFLLALPDGTRDSQKRQFWNATDGCCDLEGRGVDDVAYLNAVVDDVMAHYAVDPKRIYVTGHSNGGFMSHRLACDSTARFAAIVSLAGADWKDPSRCPAQGTIAVLQVHGDQDATVPYDGGAKVPSAKETARHWAQRNGCIASQSAGTRDLVPSLPGEETQVERWSGCRPGGAVELWTLRGGDHLPVFDERWAEAIYGFMDGHPK